MPFRCWLDARTVLACTRLHTSRIRGQRVMILLIGSEKGGVGKTTIAVNLATALAHRGRDVLLVDADRQLSAAHWAAERTEHAPTAPRVHCVERHGDVLAAVQDLAGRYQDVVIDAGGRDSRELRSAMLAADLVLCPLRASQVDLWATEHLAEIVQNARILNRRLRAIALLNLCPTNSRATEPREAREMLAELPVLELAESAICDRKAFRDSFRDGRGVCEWGDGKAAGELAALLEEVGHGISDAATAAH